MPLNWDQSDRTDPRYAPHRLDGAAERAHEDAEENRERVKILCDEFALRLNGLIATRDISVFKTTNDHLKAFKTDFPAHVAECVFEFLTEDILDLPTGEQAAERVYGGGE